MLQKDRAALCPPMGWNSWDCYGASVTEEALMQNARFMAEHLKPYGWEYVVCDIQWAEPTADSCEYHPFAALTMDAYGRLLPAPNRFPSGFRAIADQIHAMGLKFGIHIMRGIPRQAVYLDAKVLGTDATARDVAAPYHECHWNTDMYGLRRELPEAQAYYDSIFALYAEWGVDLVKVDDVARTDYNPADSYDGAGDVEMIRRAIDRCGRQMVLSLSPGPAKVERAWHLCQHANMWRITDDMWDRWPQVKAMFERCDAWQTHVRPGCWPDCDMLPLGTLRMFNGGEPCLLTRDEQRTLMTLWCLFRSPLMMGGELTRCDAFTLSLLQNEELLYLDQHGTGAYQLSRSGEEAAWEAQDERGARYVGLFNLSDTDRKVQAAPSWLAQGAWRAREVWSGALLERPGASLSAQLPAHGCALYKLEEEGE